MRTTLACLLVASALVAGEQRYRLEPGTELIFTATSQSTGDLPMQGTTATSIWVVRRNDAGTYRVVVRTQTSMTVRGQKYPDRVKWGWCDLAPDGSYEPNATTDLGATPSGVLPPLSGADAAPRRLGAMTYTYRPERTALVYTVSRPSDRIYKVSRESRLTFESGLPSVIETRSRQGYGFKTQSTSVTKLSGKKKHDTEWMRTFGAEMEAYFEAARRYGETVDEGVLAAALARATLAPVREQLRKLVEGHAQRSQHERERAQREAKYLLKPSPAWETTDFEGNKHSVKGHRGKVLLLDFWYRGCGWCIRAMPQLKQVADHFKGKPVLVLGMNTDRREEDATFVIETMGLNYANLKAQGIPEQYGVRGFPTLVVIDRKGTVREFHVGYAPDLREKLVKVVEGLLAEG